MTAHPIDTEALRERAAHVYQHGGPANAVESLAANVPAMLDLLAAAEHRATRAEAQSEARRIDNEYWKDLARQRTAQIKAMEDVLMEWESNTIAHQTMQVLTDIQKALEGE